MKSAAVSLIALLPLLVPAGAQTVQSVHVTRIPVYFPVAASTLTPEALAAVDEAAETIKDRQGRTKIIVASGERTSPDGQDLVAARAEVIQTELIARGVSPHSISLLTTGGVTAAVGPHVGTPADRSAEIIIEPGPATGL